MDHFRAPALPSKIWEHILAEYPREACGLLVKASGEISYFPCRNISESDSSFSLAPEDYAAAEDLGEVVAVVHSHPEASSEPSQSDYEACFATGLPWIIIACNPLSDAFSFTA